MKMMFKEYIRQIKEATEFLAESFDSPHSKKEIFPKLDDEAMKQAGVSDFHRYELGSDAQKYGHLTCYKRKGAYEIHHSLGNLSGEMVPSDKPNPRFVATMLQHAKGLIDSGNNVRIVGHKENGMFDHYHRIAKALARKNGYHVSTPTEYSDTSSSPEARKYSELSVSKLQECTVFKAGSGGPLEEFWTIETFTD